jgi:hypothetical protein
VGVEHGGPRDPAVARRRAACARLAAREAAGEYRPGTPEGDALLAHELAHVQQQRGGVQGPELKKRGEEAAPGEAYEADADSAAAGVLERVFLEDPGKVTP